MKFFLNIFLIFIALYQAKSQIPTWQEIEIRDNINIEQCLIDSLGFLWALSGNGLYKYDGYEFLLKHSPEDETESFLSFSQNENKCLLIGSSRGRLIHFNPYQTEYHTIVTLSDSLPITKINCPNAENDCLLISYGKGISILKDNFQRFITQEDDLLSNEVYEAIWSGEELIFATDQGIQVSKFEEDTLIRTDFSLSVDLLDVINTNVLKSSDGLWVTYFADSISKLSNVGTEHYKFKNLGRIQKIAFYNENLFIASENGLFELDNGDLLQKYPTSGRASVKDFAFDAQGNIWIINAKRKLLRASLLFQMFSPHISEIQALQFVDNEIWIGNYQGLYRLKENKLDRILDNNVTCLEYRDGFIWVGTFSNGFYVLNKQGSILHNK